MSQPYDWTRFTVHAYYSATPEELLRVWATSRGLCSFFLEEARLEGPAGEVRGPEEPARSGDRYAWTWRQGGSLEGTFLRVEEQLVAFSFGSMQVEVRLVPVEGGTRLDLLQTDIADDERGRIMGHLNCRSCWVFFLTNLLSVLHHGTDLRDRSPERTMSMEVGFPVP